MPITGFQAVMSVNDGASDAQAAFTSVITFSLPAEEVGEAEVTTLNQTTGGGSPVPDPVRRFIPTLEDPGILKGEAFFSKAEYLRLRLLKGKQKTWLLKSPDEDPTGTESLISMTGLGFLKKIDEVAFVKDQPTMVKFEVRRAQAWTVS